MYIEKNITIKETGRELDLAVATEIMGYSKRTDGWRDDENKTFYVNDRETGETTIPWFSSDLNSAFSVLSTLIKPNKKDFLLEYTRTMIWHCGIEHDGGIMVMATADASQDEGPALAICRAALFIARAGRDL